MATSPALLAHRPNLRRRVTDKVMRALTMVAAGIAMVPLILVIYYLLKKGLPAWNVDFFTTDPTGSFLGDPGGIKSAIVGSIVIVGIATLLSVPIGIFVAVWVTQYGRRGWFAQVIRYLIDVMTGVPSIVFGLFVFTVLVAGGGGFAGWKGAVAIGLLSCLEARGLRGGSLPGMELATYMRHYPGGGVGRRMRRAAHGVVLSSSMRNCDQAELP